MSKLSIAVNGDDHMQGNPTAERSLVEYGDYECPHCGAAYPIVKKLQKHFGKRLSFVFRNFPLAQIHPWAEPAAEVAEFAGGHGKFWEMHDLLFENQERLGEALFLNLADKLDLSTSLLQTAIANQTYRARVRADFSGGVRSGVNGPFDFDSLTEKIELAPSLNR
jgi:protein-disulfide isomerase